MKKEGGSKIAVEQTLETLYERQKSLPVRIDSIYIETKEGDGISRCLRPDNSYKDRKKQYSYAEFRQQPECEQTGDH
ncbi:hypothetical protein [Paenibacillus donghaensis]|uniref:Uncharacterized protein n=1 Tax=Paenibacillus donghaensis TaxID=414771 RepID=A0A2Z2KGA2_9BACL|nr:hypothetical protein [Paenibacillus donghaensis]ASA21179.1 hypothetical protein B9T62_10500 [Paenibacillus donghaensis]